MSKIFSLDWISLISQEELSLCAVALGNLEELQVVNTFPESPDKAEIFYIWKQNIDLYCFKLIHLI